MSGHFRHHRRSSRDCAENVSNVFAEATGLEVIGLEVMGFEVMGLEVPNGASWLRNCRLSRGPRSLKPIRS